MNRQIKSLNYDIIANRSIELENDEYVCDGTESSVAMDVSTFESDDLEILIDARTNAVAQEFDRLQVILNSDTGSNYESAVVESTQAGTISSPAEDGYSLDHWLVGSVAGATAAAGRFSGLTMNLPNFTGAHYKQFSSTGNVGVSTNAYTHLGGGIWRNTDPITLVTFLPTTGTLFAVGSRFKILGKRTSLQPGSVA